MQLEVWLAGRSTDLIGAFVQDERGQLSATRAELEELGVRVPSRYGRDEDVLLSDIAGLTYEYDEPAQRLRIELPEALQLPRVYDARRAGEPAAVTSSAIGGVLNYELFGAGGGGRAPSDWTFQGLSATLEGRLFSPLGLATQTAVVTADRFVPRAGDVLRLDSTWSYADPEHQLVYRAGDVISGAQAWTRPIRLGGVQVQRNFALRPDLVTLPLPSISGSAAVPSTVDVYLNGVRGLSQAVSGGPFRITDIPILSGRGEAKVVVRDAAGREVETTLPFFVSDKLLREGLLSFSAEIGAPRLYYGSLSNVYAAVVAGSASITYGLTDRLTLQAHAEGVRSLYNGGLGFVLNAGDRAIISAATAVSHHDGRRGMLLSASLETRLGDLFLSASTLRTFGAYHDLASVTAPTDLFSPGSGASQSSFAADAGAGVRPARALDRIALGAPLPFVGGAINVGFVRSRPARGSASRVLTASYSRDLFRRAILHASGWLDIGSRNDAGVLVGLTVPFDDGISAAALAGREAAGATLGAEITKPVRQEPGSFGWRLAATRGMRRTGSIGLGYRGSMGQVEGALGHAEGAFQARGQIRGSLVAAGGDIFLANTIDDAFAVVDAGAPDVAILFDNKPMAVTGRSGKALVPSLRSYQRNRLALDPAGLPMAASIARTEEIVVPAEGAGVTVDFGVSVDPRAAIVVLHDAQGVPLRTGLVGRTATGREFVVGYEGQAYIEALEESNVVEVEREAGRCRATFAYAPRGGEQVSIGPVTCQ